MENNKMIEDLFFKPDYRNFGKVTEMFNYLHSSVLPHIDPKRPLTNGSNDKYSTYLAEKNMPENGRSWESIFEELSNLFDKSVNWQNPMTAINITPPVNIPAMVASSYTALFNPNFAQDESCGMLISSELIVIQYLSQMAGWDSKKAGGIFTFGGKGTNLYAVEMGLKKCNPLCRIEGIKESDIVISNEKAHPCHAEVCSWLGIGSKNCIRVKNNATGTVDLKEFELVLRRNIEEGKKIACIILNGGTTNEVIVDPIADVVHLRDKLVDEYNLEYIPHIHVDAVIGWAWLCFKDYDFCANSMHLNDKEVIGIKSLTRKISEICLADSFGADFHKTGFCPYVSSIIMARNIDDLYALGKKPRKVPFEMSYGEYSPFEYSLELTRAASGPVAAYVTLELFGINGFRELIHRVYSSGIYLREMLSASDEFEVINDETEGIATLFIAKQPLRSYNQTKEIFNDNADYNHQFYLFIRKLYYENRINLILTFSKSYKPYDHEKPTGALKIYQTSPLITICDQENVVNQLLEAKKQFDKESIRIEDSLSRPDDFVYRQGF